MQSCLTETDGALEIWRTHRFQLLHHAQSPYLAEKIRLVVDLYDRDKYEGFRNYYDKKNPLTAENKIGPHVT